MPAAGGNFILDKGYDASAAIVRYRAVKFTATETVGPITAIGDDVAGVALFGITAGELANGKGASVRRNGIAEMEASEAIAAGAEVCITSDGRAQTEVTAATGATIIGTCEHPSTGVGGRCSVQLNLANRTAA